jgi:hypothetical protein
MKRAVRRMETTMYGKARQRHLVLSGGRGSDDDLGFSLYLTLTPELFSSSSLV